MSEISSRVGGQYGRRRAIQACLVCRARKSRCDSERPKCGFCVRTDSECTYPETETTKLDRASLLILERIQTMEINVLHELNVTALPRSSQAAGNQTTTVDPGPLSRANAAWPNGDIIMTWHTLRGPATRCGTHSNWGSYRDELYAGKSQGVPSTPGLSPSMKFEFSCPSKVHAPHSTTPSFNNQPNLDFPLPMDMSSDIPNPLASELAAPLIDKYILHVHSRWPVLDISFLRRLLDCILEGGFVYDGPILTTLPANFEEPDLAILMLVLALGRVSSELEPRNEAIPQNHYIKLALPWLGLTSFSGKSPIQDLQAQLLLASYHMWILKPWTAWCYVDAAASKAEKLLLRHPEIIEDKLSHRVLWAVTKMQLELAEEVYPFLDVVQCSRLSELIQKTQIPPPPLQPFVWPGIESHLDSSAWHFYLAETSSRRLLERIKIALHENPCRVSRPSGEKATQLAAEYSLACELERQVGEWMSSLPEDFRVPPDPITRQSLVTTDELVYSTKQRMHRILHNRRRHLLMLVFRPFLAILADGTYKPPTEDAEDAATGVVANLLEGARKYLQYAIEFIDHQEETAERHDECWLLSRNIWSAGLSLLAGCHTPIVLEYMEHAWRDMSQDEPANVYIQSSSFYEKAVGAAKSACTMLRQWEHESRSLSAGAELLLALVIDAQRHR